MTTRLLPVKLAQNLTDCIARAISVCALCAATFATTTHAQGWETVFTLLPVEGSRYIYPTAILLDPFSSAPSASSRLLVGTSASTLVLVEPDTGTFSTQTWSGPSRVSKLAFDPASQTLYAMSGGPWQVRSSSDRGASWVLLDSFGDNSSARGFASDDQGNIYVSGYTNNANGTSNWIVRKSSNQGLNWTMVDRQSSASPSGGMLFVPGPQGGLFVAGSRFTGTGWIWTVRRSRNGGATWTTVDSFSRSGKDTGADGIVSDPQGRIYVAGSSVPDPWRWELRVSENGGDTWKTASPPIATVQLNGSLRAGIVVDLAGNLFLAGLLDAWAVVRRTADGVWQDIEYPLGGPDANWVPSSADVMTIDALGNVFVAGEVKSASPGGDSTSSLVIQKLAATVLPPLSVRRSGDSLIVSWPAAVSGAQLESTETLDPTAIWLPVAAAPVVIGVEQAVTLQPTAAAQFFRLRKP